jgi:predicted nicotinamide N-methyase
MFPHGLSGLKLWESNVVLSRFVVMNNSLFKNKKVLELGAGTGIGGIAVAKWTQCQSIAMSDSR